MAQQWKREVCFLIYIADSGDIVPQNVKRYIHELIRQWVVFEDNKGKSAPAEPPEKVKNAFLDKVKQPDPQKDEEKKGKDE